MERKIIKLGNFVFKKKGSYHSDIIILIDGEYTNIRNSSTDFIRKAILTSVNLDDSYDVYIRYKFEL